MKDINIPIVHILLLLQRGYREAPDSPSLSITLQVRCCLSAPVRLEVSTADRLQAAPSRTLEGRLRHRRCVSLHLGPHCFSVNRV